MASRFALAGVATATMLIGLAAVGGVSRAATEIAHIASVATGRTSQFGKRLAVVVNTSNAANDQYGGGGGGTTTTTETTTTTTTSSEPTSGQSTETSQSAPADSGSSGSVSVTPASSGGTTAPTVISIDWAPTTFSSPVTVAVNSAPPEVTSSALVGSGNAIVSVTVTDANGQVVHQLSAPLAIRFTNPPKGFIPVVSTDGVNFRQLTKISGTTLAADQQDGYYVDTNGDIVVLTRHLTVFAVLYSANVNVSESGKKTPAAGSGKFGDPTRNHTGAPVLKQVGLKIVPVTTPTGTRIPFTFSVDEQAAIYLTIYDSKGNAVWIDKGGTVVRGATYSGGPLHTLHLVILRPGQIKTSLKLPAGTLKSGQRYKIRIQATDFDGHTVTEFTTFTA